MIPKIPNYEILDKIGEGGMGSVYKARQRNMDRFVALKILTPYLSRQAGFVERFLREARAAGKLNHMHIVQGYDVGEHQGTHYFAMEYVHGRTLSAILKEKGKLPESRCLEIAVQVAEALDHAKKHGIVHRDLKPDNIMITDDGILKVCDLGLAKQMFDATLTSPNAIFGSPAFMSPEQAAGSRALDTRSDLYALGICMFQMVCGRLPFRGDSPHVVIHKHIYEDPPDLREFVSPVSQAYCDIVRKLLAKDPADRFQTPKAMITHIQSFSRVHGTPLSQPQAAGLPDVPPPSQSARDAPPSAARQDMTPRRTQYRKRRRKRSRLQKKLAKVHWPAVFVIAASALLLVCYWIYKSL